MSIFRAGRDYPAHVLPPVFAPVPHEKRMGPVIRVAATIHLDIAWIIGKLSLVFLTQVEGVTRLRQQTIKELDVTGMKIMIEFVVAGMMNYERAAFFQQRLVAIKVEVIA